jgi:hypothetical protein
MPGGYVVRLTRGQCTLTVWSSYDDHALATAASRLSVTMISVPSAAWRANSLRPDGSSLRLGACGKHRRHLLGPDRPHIGDLSVAEMGERFGGDLPLA